MKKFLAMLLALVMVFALCACGLTASAPEAAPAEEAAPAAEDAALRMLTENKLSCHREVRETQAQTARTLLAAQFGEQALGRLPRENPAALLALGNLSFWLCDRALTAITPLYRQRIAPRLKKKF